MCRLKAILLCKGNNMKILNASIVLLLSVSHMAVAMEAILDEEMSGVTGQAGITVETTTSGKSSFGEIRYDDIHTNADGEKIGGSLSIRDLVIDDISSTLVMDVSESEMIFRLTEFATTDINIAAIQFGYDSAISKPEIGVASTEAQLKNQYGSLGSIAINDYTLDKSSNISFKFNTDGQIAFNAELPSGSFFYFTYIDDGEFTFDTNNDGEITKNDTTGFNYLHTKVSFTDFKLEDVKLGGGEDERGQHLLVSLSNVSGGIAFEDISINGRIAGTIGLESINVNPVSYMKIRGY